MSARRPRLAAALPLAALAALTLTACGRSGYGTVNAHRLVLIPTALPTSPAARRADAELACGARTEAHLLHHALTVARPRDHSPSAQIAVANQVTAKKPGGVLIVPVAANPMLAPILSMRRAGIKVMRLPAPRDPRTAAGTGARGVAWAVSAIEGHSDETANSEPVRLLDRCESVH
jgi:ABC-type sugar transport system substrate-binding protein